MDTHKPLNSLARLLLALGFLVLFARNAEAWWNAEWALRKKITLEAAAATEALDSVPVLIRLHEGTFRFADAKDDGSDLRVIAEDDKTPLDFHLEKFDPLLNEAFLWVKVPKLAPGTKTSIWLYYGNAGSQVTKPEGSKATYDPQTVLVYHFAESGSPAADSSGNNNGAQNPGTPLEGALIGPGVRLDGRNSITIPPSASLAWSEGAAFTLTTWVRPTGANKPNATLFYRSGEGKAVRIGWNQTGPFVEITNADGTQRSAAGASVQADSWHHLAVVSNGSELVVYVDGNEYAKLQGRLPALDTPLLLGGESGNGFAGELDELALSKVARPASYIKFEAGVQGPESKLVTVGEDEVKGNWLSWISTGYFGIIVRSLTTDGWIVIGFLLVMSATSWVVMVSKLNYLNRISRGNALFMREWELISADPTRLSSANESSRSIGEEASAADQKAIRVSSIYRIYRIGAEQIQHRLSLRPDAPKSLTSRGIQAIRARLDGGLVRETERLNKQIVLLTIAISGGPFLGLLGTVIGVMITFAAVAAAGDVNVNAIAPGIAAALLATVAGLGVAIPALFGYNYLLSRIKATTNDMHVFIDEFVTSMAEHYRNGPPD